VVDTDDNLDALGWELSGAVVRIATLLELTALPAAKVAVFTWLSRG
jgi:hypothetical protein